MAILVRNDTNPTVGASPRSINKPVNMHVGDLILLQVSLVDNIAPDTLPSGFTLVAGAEITGGNNIRIYSKIATGSEPATYDVTFASGDGGLAVVAIFADSGGVLSVDAISSQSNASSTDRIWPSVTTTQAAGMALFFAALDTNTGSTPPAGATEQWDAGAGPRLYMMQETIDSAGATGTRTATGSASASKCISIAVKVAFDGGGGNIRVRQASVTPSVSSPGTIDKPAGVVAGDLLLLHFRPQDDVAPSVPAGFTLVAGSEITGTVGIRVYSKVAGASEPDDYTLTWASGTARIGLVAIYSSTDLELVLDAIANNTDGVNDTAHICPSVTTTVANTLLVCFVSLGTTDSNPAPPAGMEERYDNTHSTAMVAASEPVAAIGATGTRTFTTSGATISKNVTMAWAELTVTLLDAGEAAFLRVQAGKQGDFDEAVVPTFALPVIFDYQDGDLDQLAKWDPGVWTPLQIVAQIARFATFRLRGTLFFEVLPVLLSAGFGDMEPSGLGPYSYADSVAPGATGIPAAYTFRFGGNDAGRSQNSMVQVQDAHLHALTLSFNLNDKAVTFESEWFGRYVDDNDGVGYEPEAVTLPPSLAMVQGLLSSLAIQDAGVSGGAFDVLDEFECSLIEWQLAIDTGLRPAWAADGNALVYCGIRHEWPSVSFSAHLRTNLSNYAVTKVKANLRQYQELYLAFHGADGRQAIFNFTGRWLPRFQAHDRSREEVIMRPTFQVETPNSQVTTPHWMSYQIDTRWGDA